MTTHVQHRPGEPCNSRNKRGRPVLVQDPSTATITLTPEGRRVLERSKRTRARPAATTLYVAVFCVAFGLGTALGLVLS